MHLSLLKGGVRIRPDYLDGLLTWPVFTGQMLQVHILSNECLEDKNLKSGADSCSNDYQTSFSPFYTLPRGLHAVWVSEGLVSFSFLCDEAPLYDTKAPSCPLSQPSLGAYCMVGTVPGLGQWFFFTKTMCQDTRPSLTPRFLFNRYGVLPSPTLTNGHQ